MAKRMFRVIASGQWCGAVLSDAAFADDGAEFADRLAVDLSLEAGALEVVDIEDDDQDPREGDLLLPDEPEPAAPVVDVQAFKLAAMTTLGLPLSVSLTAAGYLPLFTEAVNARNWALARQIVDYATQQSALTTEQRALLVGLMDEHGIPEA
jgi:hypothetical protein